MRPNKYYSLESHGSEADLTIYGDVTSWPCAESGVSAYNLSKQIEGLDADVINVGINSYGGEVAEGLAIYNALKRHKAKVVTRCDGFACSIASVIFAAGDERLMNDASLLMIHNAWSVAEGNAADLRKMADDLDKINAASVKAYMTVVSIEQEELQALMDSESWLDADKAVEIGLATGIITSKSDKPSQSVRRKVYDMLINPYQLEESEKERDPETEEDTEETEETSDEEETEEETDSDEEEETSDEETEEPDPDEEKPKETEEEDEEADPEREPVNQFLRAIINM